VTGLYAVVEFREKNGCGWDEPAPAYGNTQIELAWTVVPVLIVVSCSWRPSAIPPSSAVIWETSGLDASVRIKQPHYSARRVSTGFTAAARRAGR
jgi:hypothetical protein